MSNIDKEFFKVIDTHDKSYILGMIASDGCVKNKYTIRISLIDKDILEDISNIIYKENRVRFHKNNNMYCLNLNSKDLVGQLANHGIVPNKTKILKHTFNIPDEFYSSFVLGYFDGDGTVNPKRKNCSIKILGTRDVLYKMAENINRLSLVEPKVYNCKDFLYRLEVSGSNKIKPFIKWMYTYDLLCLDRKKIKCQEVFNRKTLRENISDSVEKFKNGSYKSMKDFCTENNINYNTFRNRVKRRKHEI